MRRVSIIIPTQRRPGFLRNAARSALAQRLPDRIEAELVIVDNDPEATARVDAQETMLGAPFSVLYVHEPKPGVATARNAGLKAATGDLIAFLDDDEEAPPEWLGQLIASLDALGADAVFGPIETRLPPNQSPFAPYFEAFFARSGPAADALIPLAFGCGNCLILRRSLPDPVSPFPVARDHNGGEDDYVFSQMKEAGAKFGFCAAALVLEHPQPARLSLRYTLVRAFAYGQGGTAHRARRGLFSAPGIAFSMATGLGQFLVFGATALALRPFRPVDFARFAEKSARGLGKLFWLEAFYPKLYGRI